MGRGCRQVAKKKFNTPATKGRVVVRLPSGLKTRGIFGRGVSTTSDLGATFFILVPCVGIAAACPREALKEWSRKCAEHKGGAGDEVPGFPSPSLQGGRALHWTARPSD